MVGRAVDWSVGVAAAGGSMRPSAAVGMGAAEGPREGHGSEGGRTFTLRKPIQERRRRQFGQTWKPHAGQDTCPRHLECVLRKMFWCGPYGICFGPQGPVGASRALNPPLKRKRKEHIHILNKAKGVFIGRTSNFEHIARKDMLFQKQDMLFI